MWYHRIGAGTEKTERSVVPSPHGDTADRSTLALPSRAAQALKRRGQHTGAFSRSCHPHTVATVPPGGGVAWGPSLNVPPPAIPPPTRFAALLGLFFICGSTLALPHKTVERIEPFALYLGRPRRIKAREFR